MQLKLIGFSGKIGVGKSTAAKTLAPAFICMPFGKYLKDMLRFAGLEYNQISGPLEDKERAFYWKVDNPKELALNMIAALGVDIHPLTLNLPSDILSGYTPQDAANKLISSGVLPSLPCTLHTTPRKIMQTLGTEWGRVMHADFWTRLWEVEAYPLIKQGKEIVADDVRFPNEVYLIHKHAGKVVGLYNEEKITNDNHISEAGITPDKYIYNRRVSIDELSKLVRDTIYELERNPQYFNEDIH